MYIVILFMRIINIPVLQLHYSLMFHNRILYSTISKINILHCTIFDGTLPHCKVIQVLYYIVLYNIS